MRTFKTVFKNLPVFSVYTSFKLLVVYYNCGWILLFRYAVIVHPIKARSWCSLGRTHRIILIVWASAIVLSSPTLYIMVTYNYSTCNRSLKSIHLLIDLLGNQYYRANQSVRSVIKSASQ